jgi:adenosylcobinamide kinase/adenosylcobinamide-phosphate guanylyltransferase
MASRLTLILGGARSGKSALAQKMAERGGSVLYVATARAGDEEMAARIARHRSSRPKAWRTLEAEVEVGPAIEREARGAQVIVLDCLTLLASNVLGGLPEPVSEESAQPALDREVEGLLHAWRRTGADWIVVSNEVGLGIVPATPLGRVYRDLLGRSNQRFAAAADSVLFLVAGVAMKVK